MKDHAKVQMLLVGLSWNCIFLFTFSPTFERRGREPPGEDCTGPNICECTTQDLNLEPVLRIDSW